MNCRLTGTHRVKPGDSLYKIAQMHQMALEDILAMNPGVDPYNLQVGQVVFYCRDMEVGGVNWPDMNDVLAVSNGMRQAWANHVCWGARLLVSIVAGLDDQEAVANRLMRTPGEIGAVFAGFYPEEQVGRLVQLLAGHVQLEGDLIRAWNQGQMDLAGQLNRQWYENASQVADHLASMNPYFDRGEVAGMLYRHLELLKNQIAQRLARNDEAEVAAGDQVGQEAMMMADYFTSGILQQLPESGMPR